MMGACTCCCAMPAPVACGDAAVRSASGPSLALAATGPHRERQCRTVKGPAETQPSAGGGGGGSFCNAMGAAAGRAMAAATHCTAATGVRSRRLISAHAIKNRAPLCPPSNHEPCMAHQHMRHRGRAAAQPFRGSRRVARLSLQARVGDHDCQGCVDARLKGLALPSWQSVASNGKNVRLHLAWGGGGMLACVSKP